ncbi:MAG: InlB B-repeat-containing protein, partial [Clostridiales Family XIII bacterium]|nr:InlB B-repeat-containing protein [Clostridiales Family XIII bacterium]
NKSGIPVSAQNINIDSYQLYVIRTATGNGVFPLKFSIADGAAVTVNVIVYDKVSAGNPATNGTIFANDFRLSVAAAQALTESAAVRHSGAVAKDKNGVAVLPANIKTDVDELAAINAATDNCILPLTFSIEDGAEVTVDVTVYDKGSAGAPAVDGTIFANDFRIALSAASDLTADEAITKSGAVATDAKGLAVVPANIEADADELAAIKAKTTAKDAVFPLTFRIADGASVQIKVTVSDDRYADYVVQHYMISSAGIRLRMSETNTGEIDSLVSAVPRVYIGYRHDPKYADAKLNGTVTADGKLVLKLYYRINTYIVTFSDYDGTALKKQAVEYRGDAQAPANPSRSGYTFTGWDKAASAWTGVTSNVTVTALYVKNSDSSGNAGDNGGSGGGNNGGSGGDNNGSTGNGGNENNGNGNGGNGNNGNGNGGNGNNGSVNGGNGNGSNGNGGNGNNGNGNGNANSGGSNNGGSGGGAGNGAGGTDVAAPQQAENPAVDIEPSETPLSGAGSDTRIETPDTPKASALPGIIAAAKQQGIPVLFGGARGADGSIADGGIPLTKPDGYRAWALANLIVAAAGVLLAVIFLARAFARREDETPASAQRIVKMPWLIAGTALAAIGMILFFLTEDVRLNMVLADGWSVVNAAAIAAEAVALKLAFGRGKASA